MAFKIKGKQAACPDDPEALLRDLRKKTIPGLLSHQADVIRSYLDIHTTKADIALQLPTGSGKTLVALLVGEWRRRKYAERVVYLCPTNQLVHQVAEQAATKYGLDVHAFTGSKNAYSPQAVADWQSAETLGITNYSSLFNINPFFSDPHLIILDDAHSADNYIADYWSLLIERGKHKAAFSALLNLLVPQLPIADRTRLTSQSPDTEEHIWVEKLPTPVLQKILPELLSLLDEYTSNNDLKFPWSVIRDSLHACHLYVSRRAVLIRPLIPPSNTHPPFVGAKQRLYMSATLGAGGDLERITGRFPIHRIKAPAGWDKQGIGRRFFIFPKRALDDDDTEGFVVDSVKAASHALYLVPDDRSAARVAELVKNEIGVPVFTAAQIEESKGPFVGSPEAVAVVANRYDGIDLIDDDCRLLCIDGLPGGANLQERFFILRVTAQLLLDDRILTRLVQGFGRCTRSPNDYAAVIILGEKLNGYLFGPERREFFHPEIQAELGFGLQQSNGASAAEMLQNLRSFLAQDADWDEADKEIVASRAALKQKTLAATAELASAVKSELDYQYALWNGDFNTALEHCRSVIGKLTHSDLRGYRALWLYLAGAAAWLAHKAGHLPSDDTAKDYFRQAQAAAPVLRWLVALQTPGEKTRPGADALDPRVLAQVERLEHVLEDLGVGHNRKYDAEEKRILEALLQNDDGLLFEEGHKRLGTLLGFKAGNSNEEGAPDPWWIADDSLCFVFEDHAEASPDSVLSLKKARQASSHPAWIRAELELPASSEVIPVIVTPCSVAAKAALPHLQNVRYWRLDSFREWAKAALKVVRELRSTFPGPGDFAWRTSAAHRLKACNAAALELSAALDESAADAMNSGDAESE